MPRISYQLYCSRNFPPLLDTLKMLSAAGFKEVEAYGGMFDNPSGFKSALEKTGLSVTSAHMGIDMLRDDGQRALEIAQDLGIKAVFGPHVGGDDRPSDAAGWAAFGAALQEMGKPFVDAGIAFGWHNHDFELTTLPTGELPLDLMLSGGPDLSLELDLGWVKRAGMDPVAAIEKYRSRIAAVHIKDLAPDGECADEDGWADVGHGTMDWAAIHAALQGVGVDHYVLEHDNPSDDTRFATRSIATLQTL